MVRRQFIRTQKCQQNWLSKKFKLLLEILQTQSQTYKRKTQPLPLSKILVFSERPLSQQHVVRLQLIRKQKSL